MDFDVHYTPEQESFRIVLRAWLEERAPKGLNISADGRPLPPEVQAPLKEFRRLLGSKGWLAPSWPREAGGADLSPALGEVLQEELQRLHLPSLGDNPRWIPAILVWGSEEQRRRYVSPAIRGELITWLCFNEPDSGTDLASTKTLAVRDGSDYLINGIKCFITGRFDPDYLWTLVVTDSNRPQRLNLGVFMIDAHSPGITIRSNRLLVGSERFVFFDNVRVPSDCLIGSPFLGWEIAQAVLEGERGGFAFRLNPRGTVESIKEYLKEDNQS